MVCDDLALNIGVESEIYMGCLNPVRWEVRSGHLNVAQSCVHIRLNPHDLTYIFRFESRLFACGFVLCYIDNNLFWILNYTNPGYGLSLVDTLWNAGSYWQPLEQEGNPMT